MAYRASQGASIDTETDWLASQLGRIAVPVIVELPTETLRKDPLYIPN